MWPNVLLNVVDGDTADCLVNSPTVQSTMSYSFSKMSSFNQNSFGAVNLLISKQASLKGKKCANTSHNQPRAREQFIKQPETKKK